MRFTMASPGRLGTVLRIIGLAAVVAVALLVVWAAWIEPGQLKLREVRVEPENWPAELAPLTIAVLSDLHVGSPSVSLERLSKIVERTNAAAPDVIALAGDFMPGAMLVGGTRIAPEAIAERLGGLRARHGTFAVLGNNDWWFGGERVARSLAGAGIVVLENRAVEIDLGGGSVWVAGLADEMTRSPDAAGTLARVRAGEAAIVLMHDPAAFAGVPSGPYVSIAGHTHGGQIRPPFVGPLWVPGRAPRRWAHGHVVEDGRHLVVSAGVGTSIMPLRLNAPPELVVITVQAPRR